MAGQEVQRGRHQWSSALGVSAKILLFQRVPRINPTPHRLQAASGSPYETSRLTSERGR